MADGDKFSLCMQWIKINDAYDPLVEIHQKHISQRMSVEYQTRLCHCIEIHVNERKYSLHKLMEQSLRYSISDIYESLQMWIKE